MRRIVRLFVIAGLVAWRAGGGMASELGQQVDLSALSQFAGERDDLINDMPLEPVSLDSCCCGPRWYVAGIVGASFASLTTAGGPNSDPNWNPARFSGTVNDTLFTGGGAIGIALPRPSGALRVEFEGRGRDLQDGVERLVINERNVLPNDVRAADGWSTMANIWRDIRLNDRVGVYLGGGIGGGGYRLCSFAAFDAVGASVHSRDNVSAFAWQAGTGMFYNLSDRIAIDFGYRFMGFNQQNTGLLYDGPYDNGTDIVNVTDQPYGTLATAFSSSELLLSIRIYEPFRRWR